MYPGAWAAKTPDKPACIMPTGQMLTYGQLDERSNQLAWFFRREGLRRGDHIAVLMENRPEFLEVVWAALRSGLVVTPVNCHLTVGEAAYVVSDADARCLVTSASFLGEAVEIRRHVPELRSIVSLGGSDSAVHPYEETLRQLPAAPVEDEWYGSLMTYTSGTTGRPKGAVKPMPGCHPRDLPRRWFGILDTFGVDADARYLSPGAPLYHSGPLNFVVGTTTRGGTVVLLERFDPTDALMAIDEYEVTHSQWVPTMFTRMLGLPVSVRAEYHGDSHRRAIHAAAPCPPAVKERMIDWWGSIVTEYYGASEGGLMTVIDADEWLTHRGSVGRPILGDIHITDDDGNDLPAGEPGIIRASGRGTRIEYHNDADKTAQSHDTCGRVTVGDVGYVDDEGYLYLTDRKDFMIVSGGVNIYPREAEDVLMSHPLVVDVAVIGVPNDEFGEEVKAVIELAESTSELAMLAEDLVGFCRERLASFKCPRTVDFVERLPRTPAGKLVKASIREPYWEGHASRVV